MLVGITKGKKKNLSYISSRKQIPNRKRFNFIKLKHKIAKNARRGLDLLYIPPLPQNMNASLGMTQNLEAKGELQLDHHVNIHMS